MVTMHMLHQGLVSLWWLMGIHITTIDHIIFMEVGIIMVVITVMGIIIMERIGIDMDIIIIEDTGIIMVDVIGR